MCFLIWAVFRIGLLNSFAYHGFEYAISADELAVSSVEELQVRLNDFTLNEEELLKELNKIDMDLSGFYESTTMQVIFQYSQDEFAALVIEFESKHSLKSLGGAYTNIINQISDHVLKVE
ncbi:hypothetical protein [Thaumasiovibrio subtropicus]|uniref:hypothetical protein n=2 Tax=Thaumasiovibrio subtropicus TaxID=1891207 RepID=UPI001C84996D|nr:hypothetical protein [Thaumasiovibrio subtropicus]